MRVSLPLCCSRSIMELPNDDTRTLLSTLRSQAHIQLQHLAAD